ncbi:MAG: tyrosine-type recombinase/integrase [Erysipelotrichaceae bacterium]|nr:tyrosine-type recombinase/integrase [Erysipelotrichaceae bacterium]
MRNSKIEKLLAKGEEKLTEQDRKKIKEELKDYQIKNIPIYAYIKGNEVCFRIVYDNQSFPGYDDYDDAYNDYRDLKKGRKTALDLKEIRTKKQASDVTLDDGFERLLDKHTKQYKNGDLKYCSYTKKESTIKYHILPFFNKKPLILINKSDIAHFVDHIMYEELSLKHKQGEEKRLSVGMQREVLMYFKMLYKETKRWFNVETNIDIDYEVEMPSLKKTRKLYSDKIGKIIENVYDGDLEKILRSIYKLENGAYNPIFGIMFMIYFTGMRIDEVNALTPKDFDPENKTLLITKSITWHPNKDKTSKSYEVTTTKTGAERMIMIADPICMYLENYIEMLKGLSIYSDDMFIFSRMGYARTEDGEEDPFSLKTLGYRVKAAYRDAGIMKEDGTIPKNHSARHAFNTLLKDNHIEQYDRNAYVGHSNGTSVNEGYTHKSKKEEIRITKVVEKSCRNLADLLKK